ncbi:hypothetical protein AiwAL_19450 [Acidiphilium sp. AL]|uniref:nuclear transport factor 2 family protein n=1 Tax=Acidiphilium sp. AL TaxID=2871704 RepID=UPI0021CB7605|nr:hypothetical protein [Acidiphilium sp. AL]MCU4162224.1 hypothetical protein [Acidiphilium sp. AL]
MRLSIQLGLDNLLESHLIPPPNPSFHHHSETASNITEGNTVVSLGSFNGVHAGTGKSVNAAYAHIWDVVGGKIQRFRQYIDTLAVAEARQ